MLQLALKAESSRPLRVLCLGCHSDDIEIGCGGTILTLAERYPQAEFHWVVFNAMGPRESEARHAATLFARERLKGPILKGFQDGYMPFAGAQVKDVFEKELKPIAPDLVLTHTRRDAHQDHRLIAELTWNTFRDHLVLEYEIPKYDGDIGQPEVFIPLTREVCEKKVRNLMEAFRSQQAKRWFQPDTFFSLMRLRGMECNSPSGYAEAFFGRKLVL